MHSIAIWQFNFRMKTMKKIKFILLILFLIILIYGAILVANSLLFKTTLANFHFVFVMLISHIIIICGDIKLIFAIKEEKKKKENIAIKMILCGLGILFLGGVIYAFTVI